MIIPPPLRKPVTLPPRRSLRNRDAERLRLALLWQSYPPPEPVEPEWHRAVWVNLLVVAVAMLALGLCSGCGAIYEHTKIAATVLSPDAVLADETERWANRWSGATGMRVVLGTGGIPVEAVEFVTLDAKHPDPCGATAQVVDSVTGDFLRGEVVQVNYPRRPRGCPGWGYTLGHEIGHAIGAIGHADSGLMMPWLPLNVVHRIDEDSLALVCSQAPCLEFNPEKGSLR